MNLLSKTLMCCRDTGEASKTSAQEGTESLPPQRRVQHRGYTSHQPFGVPKVSRTPIRQRRSSPRPPTHGRAGGGPSSPGSATEEGCEGEKITSSDRCTWSLANSAFQKYCIMLHWFGGSTVKSHTQRCPPARHSRPEPSISLTPMSRAGCLMGHQAGGGGNRDKPTPALQSPGLRSLRAFARAACQSGITEAEEKAQTTMKRTQKSE